MDAKFSEQKQYKGRIGFTLVNSFVLLAVLPVIVVVVIALHLIDQQTQRQIINQLEAISEIKVNQIEKVVEAGQTSLRQTLADKTLYKRVTNVLILHGGTTSLLIDNLNDHLTSQALFEELFIYDLNGLILASTTEAQVGKVVSNQAYFSQSFTGDYVQPPYYEEASDELNMIITHPVFEDNRLLGVIAGRFNLDTLSVIMTERIGLGETGETYLISAENNAFVTPKRFANANQDAAHSMAIENALAGESGSGVYSSYRGVDVFGTYRWLPQLQSAFIAEIEEDEALAALLQIRQLSVFAGVIAAGIAALIGIGISLRITRPIVALTRTASHIAAGDYSQRATITQNNEIGQLANAFNIMTEELVHSIGKLDHNVHELDEANRELKRATAQAKEASRLKDEFLAIMSHELRTPLNAIIGYLGIMLMSSNLDERNTHMVRRIRANSERLLALITDILDISRIEAGRLQLYPVELSLTTLVDRLRDNMSVLADQKGLTFEISMDMDMPPVIKADEDAMTKIITNLLSNAFKFTNEGQVTLDLSQSGENLVIKVADTGIGIPPHMHEVIFERFRQVDGSSTRVHGGTGLGLSIVYHLCQAMGGTVSVESANGTGSIFTATLPVIIAQPAAILE